VKKAVRVSCLAGNLEARMNGPGYRKKSDTHLSVIPRGCAS